MTSFCDLLRENVAALPAGLCLSVPLSGAAYVHGSRVRVQLAISGRMLPVGDFELRDDGALHEIARGNGEAAIGCGDEACGD